MHHTVDIQNRQGTLQRLQGLQVHHADEVKDILELLHPLPANKLLETAVSCGYNNRIIWGRYQRKNQARWRSIRPDNNTLCLLSLLLLGQRGL